MKSLEQPGTNEAATTDRASARQSQMPCSCLRLGLAWFGVVWAVISVLYFIYWWLRQQPRALEFLLQLVGFSL